MDKPTVPDPADLGLLIPGTEEYKRAEEALEAIRKAEETDPELRRRREKRDADLTAQAARCNGRTGDEAGRQEELIRDLQKYAESLLGEAGSPEARLNVTRRILDAYIPTHRDKDALILGFRDLHAAIWTEGYPSLEERANDLRSYSQRGVERIGGREEPSQQSQSAIRGSSESERTTTEPSDKPTRPGDCVHLPAVLRSGERLIAIEGKKGDLTDSDDSDRSDRDRKDKQPSGEAAECAPEFKLGASEHPHVHAHWDSVQKLWILRDRPTDEAFDESESVIAGPKATSAAKEAARIAVARLRDSRDPEIRQLATTVRDPLVVWLDLMRAKERGFRRTPQLQSWNGGRWIEEFVEKGTVPPNARLTENGLINSFFQESAAFWQDLVTFGFESGATRTNVGLSPASEFLFERMTPDDPNYGLVKEFDLKAWAESFDLHAAVQSGKASLQDVIEANISAVTRGLEVQIVLQDATLTSERCREVDRLAEASINLVSPALANEIEIFGEDAIQIAIDRFSRKVRELSATAKRRILEAELQRSAHPKDIVANPKPILLDSQIAATPIGPSHGDESLAVSDAASAKAAQRLATKNHYLGLLEKILANTTLDKWASRHKLGRSTVFDWKAAAKAGKAPKGKVSSEKCTEIELAIEKDAKSLGLITRTDSD